MKKILIITLFLGAWLTVLSKDYFELTQSGIIVKGNPTTEYLVLEYDGAIQSDLYSKISNYLNSGLAKNSKEQKMNKITENKPSSFIINGYGKNVLMKTDNLIYNLTIMVKDGRVRVNIPTFTTHPESIQDKIYNKKGVLKNATVKEQIETFFNAIVTDIDNILSAASTSNDNNNDDW